MEEERMAHIIKTDASIVQRMQHALRGTPLFRFDTRMGHSLVRDLEDNNTLYRQCLYERQATGQAPHLVFEGIGDKTLCMQMAAAFNAAAYRATGYSEDIVPHMSHSSLICTLSEPPAIWY